MSTWFDGRHYGAVTVDESQIGGGVAIVVVNFDGASLRVKYKFKIWLRNNNATLIVCGVIAFRGMLV